MSANKRRSPLKDKALCNPGESVEAARRRLQIDVMGAALGMSGIASQSMKCEHGIPGVLNGALRFD